MPKTIQELVHEAVQKAFHDADFASYGELLRQAAMLEVREAYEGDPEGFKAWLDGECEGQR